VVGFYLGNSVVRQLTLNSPLSSFGSSVPRREEGARGGMALFSRRMASRSRPTSTTSQNESRSAAGSPGANWGRAHGVAQILEPAVGRCFEHRFGEAHKLKYPIRRNTKHAVQVLKVITVSWPTLRNGRFIFSDQQPKENDN
jgi:hypothetical protein